MIQRVLGLVRRSGSKNPLEAAVSAATDNIKEGIKASMGSVKEELTGVATPVVTTLVDMNEALSRVDTTLGALITRVASLECLLADMPTNKSFSIQHEKLMLEIRQALEQVVALAAFEVVQLGREDLEGLKASGGKNVIRLPVQPG